MIGIIKLSTGEELVGDIKSLTRKGSSTIITNPLRIIYKQSIDGMPVTFVQKYQMFNKTPEIRIFNEHIVSICEARESFIEYYKDAIRHYEQSDINIDKQLNSLSKEGADKIFESILHNMPKDSSIN